VYRGQTGTQFSSHDSLNLLSECHDSDSGLCGGQCMLNHGSGFDFRYGAYVELREWSHGFDGLHVDMIRNGNLIRSEQKSECIPRQEETQKHRLISEA